MEDRIDKPIYVRMPAELLKIIDRLAKEQYRTRSSMILVLLRKILQKKELFIIN